jgi:predicted nucleic-acid-binding Zn-ribbon protein
MMCMARLHVGPLEIDDKGFYRICMRCGHTENYPCWILNRSTGILTK